MLQGVHPIRGLLIRVRLNQILRFLQLSFLDFEAAITETRNGLRCFALPSRYILAAFIAVAESNSGSGNLHSFWDAEGHVVGDILSGAASGIVRVPVHAGYRKVVTGTVVYSRLLAFILGCHRVVFSRRKRFGQDD